jgi:hypothetical protein
MTASTTGGSAASQTGFPMPDDRPEPEDRYEETDAERDRAWLEDRQAVSRDLEDGRDV